MKESLLYFLGIPSSIYDQDNPDYWAPSQNLGHALQNVKAASQERDTIELRKRNEKRRRSESAFALLELSKPTTIEDQTNTYVEESNCRACQTDITAEYFTETLPKEIKHYLTCYNRTAIDARKNQNTFHAMR